MGHLYGENARTAELALRQWKHHVVACVEAFSKNPTQVEQSIARHFSNYHYFANNLRKALNVAKKDFTSNTWKGFISCSLTQEQKEAFGAWDIQDADVWSGLASYGESGYKFSLTYNRGNESWVATYTGQEESGKNAGWAVTGFAHDPYNAARVLLFKVSVVLPDVWKEYKPTALDEIG
jgi:hypothetical protein